MPRGNSQPYINFQPSLEEKEILEAYCKHYQITKTEALRGFIRTLQDFRSEVNQPSQ